MGSTWLRGARPLATVCAALAVGACASPPIELYSDATPPAILTTIADAGVRDLRADYRAAACNRLPPGGAPCGHVLLRLPGEGTAGPSPAAEDLTKRYRIALVPGFLSQCFNGFARPFSDTRRALEAEGFAVDDVQVSGRGTVAENARRLADHFASVEADPRPIVVFAYSKGVPDTLEFVVRYPEAAKRIAAIVSVAGAVNGSPLANDLQAAYRDWAAAFPLPGCNAGTGDEILDLRREVRLEWWRRNRQAVTVPVFTLVAAPQPNEISPANRATYNRLARVEPRNDGKLIWYDQIAPGSFLLGYVNADHWAVAIPLADELPAFSFLFRDNVPRVALMRAAIDVVAATLPLP